MATQITENQAQTSKLSLAVVWTAGVALILFCAVGIGAFMGWIPNSLGSGGDKAVPAYAGAQPVALPAAVKPVAPSAAVKPVAAAAPRAAPAPVRNTAVPAPIVTAAVCAECGVIESVREIDAKGKGTGIGAVGGAVVGGLLGNQVGAGRGQDVMTVVGAVGGAMAGNEVERRVKTTKRYEVTVRLNDGTTRVFAEAHLPAWHSGDKVRLVDGAIESNG